MSAHAQAWHITGAWYPQKGSSAPGSNTAPLSINVTDENGAPVKGLTAQNFQIYVYGCADFEARQCAMTRTVIQAPGVKKVGDADGYYEMAFVVPATNSTNMEAIIIAVGTAQIVQSGPITPTHSGNIKIVFTPHVQEFWRGS